MRGCLVRPMRMSDSSALTPRSNCRISSPVIHGSSSRPPRGVTASRVNSVTNSPIHGLFGSSTSVHRYSSEVLDFIVGVKPMYIRPPRPSRRGHSSL
uniref:Uncharacterized protein n=1 Tax=uncultured marine virus TaxID=186617 RepID=A0A0F7L6G7_9VIRU|nr:hypothetical protein [uncultured marine virus]